VAQVRFIRVVMERRRFRTDQYRKLFTLGAGRRYRPERDDLPRPQDFREDGMRLRDALTFDPAQVRTFSPVPPSEPPVAADPFLLLFTSGTSASPKAVPLTYHTMLSNARLGVAEHRITRQDRLLSAAPFSHLYGLYSVHLALAAGATMVLLPGFTPPELIATLERSQATVMFVAPAHVAACRQAGLLEQAELASLKLAMMAGSACPPELVWAWAHRLPNGTVSQLWGMTELQAGTYTRPDDPLEVAVTSAGRPSPGTEARVVAPDGSLLGPGEEGELQIRGCSVFPSYFDNA